MFIDHSEILVRAGKGGNGCNSFSKGKFQRYNRANGGDGGRGGDVIFKADNNVQTLVDFYFKRHFRAESGSNGGSNNKKGRRGLDCIIRVPVGTLIKDREHTITYCDLDIDGRSVIIARGGEGGKGNSRGREATPGKAGEEKSLVLELKLVADVGIIGFPNVGKSSFIARISNAKPKIASYPFTTKTPVLGLVSLGPERSFVICDIPGLIEGAHSGKGLGDDFLRHVERTRVLVHIIDMASVERRDPVRDAGSINNELRLYNPALLKRPQILVANKMDLPEASENLRRFRKIIKKTIYPVSCITGQGISKLLETIYKLASLRSAN